MDYFHYIFQAALIVIASIANAMRTQSPCYEERQCTKPFSGSLNLILCVIARLAERQGVAIQFCHRQNTTPKAL